jgi:DNA-binding CsgD family transcriptional regulator
MTDRKLRVFLCHASQDKPIVRELYQRLLVEGWIDPWLDEEKLLPGQNWDIEIEKAVQAADAVIVCLSESSVSKEGYIQKEIKKVLDISDEKPEGTIFLIPLRLEECEPPRRLVKWQYVDYFPLEARESAYSRLLSGLAVRAESLDIVTLDSLMDLTPLEENIYELISQGFSDEKIAAELNVDLSVVKKHKDAIFRKAGSDDLSVVSFWKLGRHFRKLYPPKRA